MPGNEIRHGLMIVQLLVGQGAVFNPHHTLSIHLSDGVLRRAALLGGVFRLNPLRGFGSVKRVLQKRRHLLCPTGQLRELLPFGFV